MEGSVSKTQVRIEPDRASIEVYPMGTDSHRITNAQKAFILHHGRKPTRKGTKEIKGDHFVTKAEQAAREKAEAAMRAEMAKYIAGKD